MITEGGCHCGAVRFRVALKSPTGILCNCSICTMKGFVHHIVERDAFTLLSGADVLTAYRFNTGIAVHQFCARCGVHAFYVPRSHPDGVDVNLRCLDGGIPGGFTLSDFDGRNWEANIGTLKA